MIYSPVAIKRHIMTYLPKLIDNFTSETAVAAEILAGAPQVLRITYPDHGYSTGNTISLVNGLINTGINNVTSFVDNGQDGLRFTTNVNHDLTEGFIDNLTDGKIQLSGFTDAQFNGFFTLYGVPSSNTFEILHNNAPVLNGNEVLREKRSVGINDIFIISGVPDVNTIDINLTGLPIYDTKDVTGLTVIDKYRMDYVADWQRAQDKYTEKYNILANESWLFIIMENVIISKGRKFDNDATQVQSKQTDQRMKNIGQFSINVTIPTIEDIGGGDAVQLVYETIYPAMLKAMAGVPFEVFGQSSFITSLISHGGVLYNKAYYAHNFTFELVYETTAEETFTTAFSENVAFRKIFLEYQELQNGSNIVL